MNLSALIIEDETYARDALEILIRENCENVNIQGYADSYEAAVYKISELKPQLLFLDIQLGNRMAFDLLDISLPDFEVIFTTAFDKYAVRAFRASAVDYLLKPIKIKELKEAVTRVERRLKANEKPNLKVLTHNRHEIKTILIPDGTDNLILHVEEISCMQGDGACTYFYLSNGKRIVASKNLGFYEKTLVDPASPGSSHFFRVHSSWMVNHPYITKTVGRNPMDVYMKSGHEIPVSRSRKQSFLDWLREK